MVVNLLTALATPAVIATAWALFERRVGGFLTLDCLESNSHESIAMELLRLRPPAWNHGRKVIQTGSIGNIEASPGQEVLVPVGFIQTSTKYWDNPLQFSPERWDINSFKTPAFIPFSVGKRACVSAQLGLANLRTALDIAKDITRVDINVWSRFRVGPLYGPPNFTVQRVR